MYWFLYTTPLGTFNYAIGLPEKIIRALEFLVFSKDNPVNYWYSQLHFVLVSRRSIMRHECGDGKSHPVCTVSHE